MDSRRRIIWSLAWMVSSLERVTSDTSIIRSTLSMGRDDDWGLFFKIVDFFFLEDFGFFPVCEGVCVIKSNNVFGRKNSTTYAQHFVAHLLGV